LRETGRSIGFRTALIFTGKHQPQSPKLIRNNLRWSDVPTSALRRVKGTEFVSGKSDPSNPSKWFQTGSCNLKSPVRADTPTQLMHGQLSRIGIRVRKPGGIGWKRATSPDSCARPARNCPPPPPAKSPCSPSWATSKIMRRRCAMPNIVKRSSLLALGGRGRLPYGHR